MQLHYAVTNIGVTMYHLTTFTRENYLIIARCR